MADLREEIKERKIRIQHNEQMKERYEKSLQQNGDDVDTRRLLAKCEEETEVMGECYSVRINSGLFGVPWVETKRVLKGGLLDMVIVRPASQKDEAVESDHDDDPYAGELHQKEDSTKTVESAEQDQEDRRQHIKDEEQIASAAQSGSMNKGLKRKNGEGDGLEEKSKKNGGGGRQTKLNFGKSK